MSNSRSKEHSRSPNRRTEVTGSNYKRLQQSAVTLPGGRIHHLSPSVFKWISCVRCLCIPDPEHYYICRNCSVHICRNCMVSFDLQRQTKENLDPVNPQTLFIQKNTRDGRGRGRGRSNKMTPHESEWKTCLERYSPDAPSLLTNCRCSSSKLKRAHPKFLELLLESTTWTCEYSEQGCNEVIPWAELDQHSEVCQFSRAWHCRYFSCWDLKHNSLESLLQHYSEIHGAAPLDGNRFTLAVDLKETLVNRLICLLKFDERHFLFTCEVSNNTIFMWIWDVDLSDSSNRVMYHIKVEQAHQRNGIKEHKSFIGFSLSSGMSSEEIIKRNSDTSEDLDADHKCLKIPLARFFPAVIVKKETEENENDDGDTLTVILTLKDAEK